MKRFLLVLSAACLVAGVASAQPIDIDIQGGGLGQTIDVTVTGAPGKLSVVLPSTLAGPTLLAPFTDLVGPLDVGLDLLSLAPVQFLDGAGQATVSFPVPNNPALDGFPIFVQGLGFQLAPQLQIDELSKQWIVTLAQPQTWAFALNPMMSARSGHGVVAFGDANDGVLVSGGTAGSIATQNLSGLPSAELYRPFQEDTVALPDMTVARGLHRTTELCDGRVLLTGGVDASGAGNATATTELYDPATQTFSLAASMATARVGHTATLLSDCRVFVMGGSTDIFNIVSFGLGAQATSELYDPATNTWSPGPVFPGTLLPLEGGEKTFHEATLLDSGNVLISGGITLTLGGTVPIFSAQSRVYSPTPAGAGSYGPLANLGTSRVAHTSVPLAGGQALIVTGATGALLAQTILATTEVFDETSNSFAAGPSLNTARAFSPLAMDALGNILAVGGASGSILQLDALASVEVLDPALTGWSFTGSLNTSRFGALLVPLTDDTFLVSGGSTNMAGPGTPTVEVSTLEVFQP